MKKRILSIFISFAILLTSLTGFAFIAQAATKSFTSGGLSCTLDTSTGVFTVSVSSGGNGRGKSYSKPTSDYIATSAAPWYGSWSASDAKYYRDMIKSVVIEDGVIEIGSYWFYNCKNLTSVKFADTVDTIGDCCFRSCTSLKSIELPKNCSWYYKELFLDCTGLKWAIMPTANNTDTYNGKLPDGTFSGCTSLEEVYIGSGHTALDTKAFYNCKSLRGVIWASGELSSVGTNALSSVPSSCTFVGDSDSLKSWCSSNGYSHSYLNGNCGTGFNYSLDTSNMKLSFTGGATMQTTPWSVYHYLIKDISFADLNTSYTIASNAFNGCENLNSVVFNNSSPVGTASIGEKAFYNCTATTYWLNLPSNISSVGANAFNNTNFNYVTLESPTCTYGTDAFGCTGYARFYGAPNPNARAFFKAGKDKGYSWFYYCLNDAHNFTLSTVAPTCTEKGYDLYTCPDCLDAGETKSNYTDMLGHSFSKGTATDSGTYVYSCNRCGANALEISAVQLEINFPDAISHDNDNIPYNQSNYDAQFDVYYDGYINAKDFMLIGKTAQLTDVSNKKTTINTATTYQTMEGFGASAAWWAQDIGRWNDEQIDRVTELLYGKTGAGLDIYRYNLGGGSENDTHIGDWRRRAEDFLSEDSDINDASTYDWNADAAARKVLASAQKANKDLKLVLFSNSAPSSITDNGKAYCSNGVSSNLSERNYQSFANYVVNCAEHFVNEGYNVTAVSPVNEPEWDWAADANGNMGQEGCRWEATPLATFYNNYMVPTLQRSSLNGKVDLSVWECAQLNHSSHWKNYLPSMFSSANPIFGTQYGNNNASIRSYVDTLDTHSYWASESDRKAVASDISGSNYSAIKKVRCTEYCQMTNDGNNNVMGHIQAEGGSTNGMTIDYALALADIMYQDITILNAVEWTWWTACSGGIYPDGLVYVNYDNPDNIQTAKRLWAMGNYAKFIDEGAVRVQVTTGSDFGKNLTTEKTYSWDDYGTTRTDKHSYIEQTAYKNPDGSIVVVYINNSDTEEFTTFGDAYTELESYVTDENRDLERYQTGTAKNRIVHIPSKSITTVILK